jgi:hypothetical protein
MSLISPQQIFLRSANFEILGTPDFNYMQKKLKSLILISKLIKLKPRIENKHKNAKTDEILFESAKKSSGVQTECKKEFRSANGMQREFGERKKEFRSAKMNAKMNANKECI